MSTYEGELRDKFGGNGDRCDQPAGFRFQGRRALIRMAGEPAEQVGLRVSRQRQTKLARTSCRRAKQYAKELERAASRGHRRQGGAVAITSEQAPLRARRNRSAKSAAAARQWFTKGLGLRFYFFHFNWPAINRRVAGGHNAQNAEAEHCRHAPERL